MSLLARALALDPRSRAASDELGRLLVDAPGALPREAAAELSAARDGARRAAATAGLLRITSVLALLAGTRPLATLEAPWRWHTLGAQTTRPAFRAPPGLRHESLDAGGTDLGVYGAHDNVYFGRIEDGVLESEFSGNLVEVCPTGVFTDKTHSERYNRKWDMQFAPSICQGCSVGCNISPGERYGELRRIENRFNGSVNQYFLCDRGRFGYGYVNNADRPRQPLLAGLPGETLYGMTPQAGLTRGFAYADGRVAPGERFDAPGAPELP